MNDTLAGGSAAGPSRRQAVVNDVSEGPLGKADVVSSTEKSTAIETTAVVERVLPTLDEKLEEARQQKRDADVEHVLALLDDPRVIAKLAITFARFDELRPDCFRSPSRWQQRLHRTQGNA